MSDKTTGQHAISLHELGWRCVHDSHYTPEMNSDAGPLFLLYPKLFQRHGAGIWCTGPGLAALAAFRRLVEDRVSPRDAAAAIGASFSDTSLTALDDASGTAKAAETIFNHSRSEYEAMRDPIGYWRDRQTDEQPNT